MRPLEIKLLLSAIAIAAMATTATAGEPLPEAIVTRETTFSVPYQIDLSTDPSERPVEVQLHVSDDGGLNWQLHGTVEPGEGSFRFRAKHEGQYWFAVRTLDSQGVLHPEGPRQPEMRVIVDTLPPELQLHADQLDTGEIHAAWQINDPQLAPESLVVDYQVVGTGWSWQLVSTDPPQRLPFGAEHEYTGETIWRSADVSAPMLVRAEVRDRAGNVAVERIHVAVSPNPVTDPILEVVNRDEAKSPVQQPAQRLGREVMPGVRPLMVNSLDFELEYDVNSVGSAGIGKVEIWGTRDRGQTWILLGLDEDKQSPCPVTVDHDGIYGFAIVVHNATGLSGTPPRSGRAPDIWVGVDTVQPSARLTTAEPGRGEREGVLTVSWQASDGLLVQRPVSLFYSASPDGPWTTIAADLENTGHHDCRFDRNAPDNIYLKLEVRDAAGNVGQFSTTQAIPVAHWSTVVSPHAVTRPNGNSPSPKYYHVLR